MKDIWTKKWNDRFRQEEYAYGKEPNDYLREQLPKLDVGTILFPAEGEGRNAVFAAKLGWEVSAFDISLEGKKKALRLADANKVTIDYRVGELLQTVNYKDGQFDAIALIYAHFLLHTKSIYYRIFDKYLRKGGIVILEGFSKRHADYLAKDKTVGGPTDKDILFSIDELKKDFPNYEIIALEEKDIDLREGNYHKGKSSVIRFLGKK